MADDLSASLSSLKIDRNAPPPRSGWLKWVVSLTLLAALGVGVVVARPHLEAHVFKTEVQVTEVATVSPAQASAELTASGYVQADVASRIAPKVPGRVVAVHVTQGQKVEAGQLLIELDPADDQAAIKAAQSQVAAAWAQAQSARAQASVTEAQLAEAKQQAARERRLASEGLSGTAVAEDLEARVASLQQSVDAAKAQAKAADANAGAFRAQVNVLQTGLQNLQLLSPISGTIINKPPQVGEYVGPQPPGVTVDMGGIRVADFRTLLVETDIPEGRLSIVKPGGPAEIVLDAYPSKRLRGKVKEITPQVDRAKATVIVKVAFDDDTTGVLPDMSARVSFLARELNAEELKVPPKTIIPAGAVTERGGAKVTFVLEEGKVRMVPLELGPAFGSGFEVVRGPSSGARVVKDPPTTLADGQGVKESE
jgi:RND family efflux transporter MFP subunit